MATDYDAPRITESDETDTSLEQLTASRKDTQSPVVDVEDTDTAESFELPALELTVYGPSKNVLRSRALGKCSGAWGVCGATTVVMTPVSG